jgi:hypothetical protein
LVGPEAEHVCYGFNLGNVLHADEQTQPLH